MRARGAVHVRARRQAGAGDARVQADDGAAWRTRSRRRPIGRRCRGRGRCSIARAARGAQVSDEETTPPTTDGAPARPSAADPRARAVVGRGGPRAGAVPRRSARRAGARRSGAAASPSCAASTSTATRWPSWRRRRARACCTRPASARCCSAARKRCGAAWRRRSWSVRRADEAMQTFQIGTLFDHYCARHHVGLGARRRQGQDAARRHGAGDPPRARAGARGRVSAHAVAGSRKLAGRLARRALVEKVETELAGPAQAYVAALVGAFDVAWAPHKQAQLEGTKPDASEGRQAVKTRADLKSARRVVVKIGSRLLAEETDARVATLAAEARRCATRGVDVVIVTSGAIALGVRRLGYREQPRTISRAAGRGRRRTGPPDPRLSARARRARARRRPGAAHPRRRAQPPPLLERAPRASASCSRAGAVPVINENDTVSVDEIKFGDNDRLAALVHVARRGRRARHPHRRRRAATTAIRRRARRSSPRCATSIARRSPVAGGSSERRRHRRHGVQGAGGARSRRASASSPSWRRGRRERAGHARSSTAPTPAPSSGRRSIALQSRKHWIAYALKPAGTLVVDAGARRALVDGSKSLLPSGVTRVEGRFGAGDTGARRRRRRRRVRARPRRVRRRARSRKIAGQPLGRHRGARSATTPPTRSSTATISYCCER